MKSMVAEEPSTALRLGRHAAGIMIAALANPMIYFGTDKVLVWLATWGPVLIATAVIYGLLTLFLTRRARAAWPGGGIALAWVLLLLIVAGNWINYQEAHDRRGAVPAVRQSPLPERNPAGPNTEPPASEEEWWKKGAKPVN